MNLEVGTKSGLIIKNCKGISNKRDEYKGQRFLKTYPWMAS